LCECFADASSQVVLAKVREIKAEEEKQKTIDAATNKTKSH
jgi:hypothetical protein